jgi:hypothetical protein
MNKCIGYAKPEDWIPAARNKRITDGGKGKIGVGEDRPALSNSQFCCNFATPVKLLNLGVIDRLKGASDHCVGWSRRPGGRGIFS